MSNVLIRFRHGLGDAVQLTVVLRHLAAERPDWSIDVQTQTGKETAFRGLCRRAFCRDRDRQKNYDLVFDLDWPEPAEAYGCDVPATKAERCLREVFQISPRKELCSYLVRVDAESQVRAENYARSIATCNDNGRYRVVLVHYEGNTATSAKNLIHDEVADVCRLVHQSGYIPVILDWDDRSPLPRDMPEIVCPDSRHSLWMGLGVGDAATITALAALSTLCIGIDSGPQKCFGASGSPTIAVWRGHHPINYYGLNPNVRHLVPHDHARLIYGDQAARERGNRIFAEVYKFSTYSEQFRDALLHEVESALGATAGRRQSLLAYSFCSAHRKSHGPRLTPSDHWEMLATAMDAWNPGKRLPEVVSVIGPLTEPIPVAVAERSAVIASAVDPGHQAGAWQAIEQAATYARHHGF
ncbi:MAG TPA: hypothetical protein VGM05_21180, partial [Planctomycetaceae bacterium]